jgi:CIC family chloride channel protein
MQIEPWAERFLVWRQQYLSEKNFILVLCVIIGLLASVAALVLKTAVHYLEYWVRTIPGKHMENYLFLVFPLVGILITVFYVRTFVKEDIGHGVSRILYAISRNKGVMKLHNTWSSIIACTFTSGMGGSVGMEAPIVSTGAAIGSNIAQAAKLGHKRTILLIGCGSAAAIAAIFKAPIAGLIFALEVLMLDLTMASILPLLVATVTGAIFSAIFMGENIEFYFAITDSFNYGSIPFFILLGLFTGLVSLYFTWMNGQVESKIKSIKKPFKRAVIGGVILGVLIFVFPPLFGEGYFSMRNLLSGQPEQLLVESPLGIFADGGGVMFLVFMIGVLFFKVIATSLTTGAGGIGGVFAPSLFMGGIAGFILSRAINLFTVFKVSEYNFTLIGMAGVMAGVIHSPLTAIFLIAEITGGYQLFIPLIIVASISYLTVNYFQQHSIYTKKLAEKGDLITHDKDKTVLTLLNIDEVIETNLDTVSPEMTLGQLVRVIAKSKRNIFPVLDSDNNFLGIVFLDEVREIMFDTSKYEELKVRNIMYYPRAVVNLTDNMDTVMNKFNESGLWNIPVVDKGKYRGYVSRSNIFEIYRNRLIEFSD